MRFFFATSALTAASLVGCGSDPSSSGYAEEEQDRTAISMSSGPGLEDRTDEGWMMGDRDTPSTGPANRLPAPRSLYVLNSSPLGNELVELRRQDGELVAVGSYDTGGVSLPLPPREAPEDGEASQALIAQSLLVQSGPYLFVANSGSSSIATFRRTNDGSLVRTDLDTIAGPPVSLAVHGEHLFAAVLPGPSNPSGVIRLEMDETGELEPTGPLLGLSAPDAQPSHVLIADQGRYLVVTEQSTGLIDVWPLREDGTASTRVISPAVGGPFSAAAFGPGYLLVTESLPIESPASTISTYRFERDGRLSRVTESLATDQIGASWIEISPDQSHAYVANIRSRSITSYKLGASGEAIIDLPVAAHVGERILGLSLDPTGRFLQVLVGESDGVRVFAVDDGANFAPVGELTDIGLSPGGVHDLLAWRTRGQAPRPGLAPDDNVGTTGP